MNVVVNVKIFYGELRPHCITDSYAAHITESPIQEGKRAVVEKPVPV